MSALRTLRVNARLSIVQLAERSGLSEDTIRDIETGKAVNPRVETLGRLADVLNVQPSDIDPVLTTPTTEVA